MAAPPLQNQRDLNICVFLSPWVFPPLRLLVHEENSSSDQRQACKKHELYVSFRDLGWQVRTAESPHTGALSVPADHRADSIGSVCSCLSPPSGQGPICPRFVSNSLCSLRWPCTLTPPASTSLGLGLQKCATMPTLCYFEQNPEPRASQACSRRCTRQGSLV